MIHPNLHCKVECDPVTFIQVEALDDLLQRERQALQEVLAAARKRVTY